MKVIGRYNTAEVYATIVENQALEQIQELCNQEWAKDCHIAIMPDAHAGAGCTVGTSMSLHGKVAPQLVGVDIGCGMYAVKVDAQKVDFDHLDKVVHRVVPAGMVIHQKAQHNYNLCNLKCYDALKNKMDYFQQSLGTLGGGNHFVELDQDSQGTYWLVIHSGSRNLGVRVCDHYQTIADQKKINGLTMAAAKAQLIVDYRAQGRTKEIEQGLKDIEAQFVNVAASQTINYIEGQDYENYLHDMAIVEDYAVYNRMYMANAIVEAMGWHQIDAFTTEHNYINVEEKMLRKGAVSAKTGERLLIPINMRDGSLLCIGKGNPDWNYTAPHGAGRLMSRMEARRTLDVEDFKNTMAGVHTSTVCESTIDEAPMAYKPMEAIERDIQDTVEVIDHWKVVYNFKATE